MKRTSYFTKSYNRSIFFAMIIVVLSNKALAINLERYYPFKEGATWNYNEISVDNDNDPNTEPPPPESSTDSIVEAPGLGSNYFKIISSSSGSLGQTYRKEPFLGLIRISADQAEGECTVSFPGNQLVMPYYRRYGETLHNQIKETCPDSTSTVDFSHTLIGTGIVTVPAGTFKTIVIEHIYHYPAGMICKIKYWFAKDIGMVKSEETFIISPSSKYAVTTTISLLSTNLHPLEDGENDDECECTQLSDGVGVDYVTGSASVYEADLPPTPYSPLLFARVFKGNSANADGSLSAGWAHNYARTASVYWDVTPGTSESIELTRESGSVLKFVNQSGVWTSPTDLKGRLTVTRSGVKVDMISYRNANDEIELYDAIGRLQSITYPGGMKTTLTYSSVGRLEAATDTFGRKLLFAYDTSGHLSSVTPSNGNAVKYTFGPEGQLEKATLPGQKARTYTYDVLPELGDFGGAVRVKSIAGQDGSEFVGFTYDELGRVTARDYGPGVGAMSIDYSNPMSRVISDSLSTARTLTFERINGHNRRIALSSQCDECEDGGSASQTYDKFGNITEKTNFNGVKTRFEYDTVRSLQISRTDGYSTLLARITKTTWHSVFRLPESISEPLRRTTFAYDASGNLLKKTVQATSDKTGGLGFTAALVGEAQV